jgi:hypothetical protein
MHGDVEIIEVHEPHVTAAIIPCGWSYGVANDLWDRACESQGSAIVSFKCILFEVVILALNLLHVKCNVDAPR